MKAILTTLALLLVTCCAAIPSDDSPPVAEVTQAVTNNPFGCSDQYNTSCNYPFQRDSNTYTRFFKQFGGTTANPYGDPGEGVRHFNIWAVRRLTVQVVEWRIEFPGGSTCLAGNCTFWICQDIGTPWPRCDSSTSPIGATLMFQGEVFEPYEHNRYFIAVWITGGPAVPATTSRESLIVHHDSL